MHPGPNPALLEKYGSAFYRRSLEKTAQPPPALLRMLAPVASGALIYADQRHREKQAYEAMVLNEMFRMLERERQAETVAGFQGKGRMYSHQGEAAQQLNPMRAYQAMMALNAPEGGMVRYASASGAALARMAMSNPELIAELEKQGMDKEAIGALLGRLAGGLGKAMGGAGRRLAGSTMSRAVGKAGPLSGLGMKMRGAGVGMQRAGQQWQRYGMGATGRFQQAAAKMGVKPTLTPQQATAQAARRAAKAAPSGPAAAAARTAAKPAAAAAPAAKSKPLLSWKTKGKILGAGAALGAGYLGYKGLQATRDYMMQPTYTSRSWGGGGPLPSGINPYGYTGVVR